MDLNRGKLNGRQIGWGIICLIVFIIFVFFACRKLPTVASIEEEWSHALIGIVSKQPDYTDRSRETYYSGMPTKELIARITSTYSKYDTIYEELDKANKMYAERIENVWASNALPLLLILTMGLALVGFMILLGLALSWIYRWTYRYIQTGPLFQFFKRKKTKT